MKLVLFLDACEHIARIARILRQPAGHALLLGVGGSGRRSLSKMATYIAGYKIMQIEVLKNYNLRTWREDLKAILMAAGIDKRPISFLFVDTQIINEQMLEDINSILNSGDVTNLYGEKEMEEIINNFKTECIKKGLQPNKMNIFTQYLLSVRKNIHIILAMSPLGNLFTTRLRMFPSLVNCCTIDWFTEWPEEALMGVGKGAIIEDEIELGIEGQVDVLVNCFKFLHKSVEKISVTYLEELRRYNYVTPKSYLELLSLYKIILKEKKNEQKLSVNRLTNGLNKLQEANKSVDEMRIVLKEKQPQLEIASKNTEKVMERLVVDKKYADEKQIQVSKEEIEASKQEAEAKAIEKQAVEAVNQANIILENCLIEVQKLENKHLSEIKVLTAPPEAVKVVVGGVVILNFDYIKKIGGEIIMKPDPNPLAYGKKIEDYFETGRRYLLNDPKALLTRLKEYDRDNINPALIAKLEQKILSHKDFSYERAKDCSYATKFLFSWVKAMYDYNKVYMETQPLRDKLMTVQKIVAEKTLELQKKMEELEKINNQIQKLENDYTENVNLKESLETDIKECEIKLERAQKLTTGLSEEKLRWGNEIEVLLKNGELIAGDSVIAAGMVSYAGSFTSDYRNKLEGDWEEYITKLKLKHTPNCTMRGFLGVPVVIQGWNIFGLPKDDTSTENGIIIEKTKRWPLMIDPQNQANNFIKNMGKDKIEILKANEPNYIKTIEKCILFGQWALLENVGKELDPSIEPILLQEVQKQGSSYVIQIGEKMINYDEKFKFFMTTTMPNPHYSPETSVKVTIINFAITPSGLEEQMLAQIVALENPQLEQKKTEIVKRNAADKKELLNIEDSILKSLSDVKDIEEILKDETLINKLQNSKKFALEINQRVRDSKITEAQIDEARESYRPVAFRASLLFFCIVDLASIDSMYQYSLQWFTMLFTMGVENSPTSNILENRLENLNSYFTKSLYDNVCRSLFEKHKLLFSLMLTIKIINSRGELDQKEWRYILAGPTGEIKIPPNPTKWIAENSWPDLYRQIEGMSRLAAFKGIDKQLLETPEDFKKVYDATGIDELIIPSPWDKSLNLFQKLVFIKSFRPDRLVSSVIDFITEKIGREFIVPPTFDLSKCYKDSTLMSPLIFVLSAGSDPVSDFLKFADEMGMSKKYDSISLGQGQGSRAEKMIKDGANKGGWVFLQNCHLAISWMPELEKIVEELNENNHKDFRLWLTSMADPRFPISILQNSIKMTLEPPKGLRSNLLRSYMNIDEKEFNDCKKPLEFKKLLFGFCLFHAIIQDRRKFGPIGWNIPYEFTNEDLSVCKRQLKLLLDDYILVPYKVINFLGAEINYGGRVTDDKDVRLIKTILQTYINPNVLEDKYKYSESGIYYSPEVGEKKDYMEYIDKLPINPEPEAFGLHDNAQITNSRNEARVLLESLLIIQPRETSSGEKSRDDIIIEIANYMETNTPKSFNFEEIFNLYPTSYKESMNTVLVQEIIRYNKLLICMKISLINVKKALKGQIVMSEELEKLSNSLFDNQVPKMWANVGFLSLKPLASWTEDLNERISFLANWVENGTPNVYWISGFFFPQAFITGTLQNYARKHEIAIDALSFEYKIQDQTSYNTIKQKPEDGCYIYGIFLEGARWDSEKHILSDSKPKELFSDLPLVWLFPCVNRQPPVDGIYDCPIYKVDSRAGTLSTTGHSTNFVMYIELSSDREQDIWIKAGVACFLALRY